MKTIIMLAGKKRSGKDSLASVMKKIDPRVKLVSFAAPMKKILAESLNISMMELEDWKNDGNAMMHGVPFEDQEDTSFEMQTYRNLLQRFGTEGMKPVFGNGVWSKLCAKQIKSLFEITDTVVVTDFRFPEEYDSIYNSFLVEDVIDGVVVNYLSAQLKTIHIERAGLFADDGHISENALDYFKFDLEVLNNGTLEDLRNEANKILEGL